MYYAWKSNLVPLHLLSMKYEFSLHSEVLKFCQNVALKVKIHVHLHCFMQAPIDVLCSQ
jgi:hypothetical protein